MNYVNYELAFWVMLLAFLLACIAFYISFRNNRYLLHKMNQGIKVQCALRGSLPNHFVTVRIKKDEVLPADPEDRDYYTLSANPREFIGAPQWKPIGDNEISLLGVIYTRRNVDHFDKTGQC